MYQDFNPLDLSAPKKPDPNKDDLKVPPVKVYRVSHGALLHSRFTKILVTIMLIILAGIGSYLATYYYLGKHPIKVENKGNTNSSSNSNSNSQAEVKQTEVVYCGVAGIPKEVCEIITSVEKDGFVDNSLVKVDTTKVSKTAKFDFSEQSWKKTDEKNGSMTFDQNDNGKITTGTVILTYKETGWTIMEIQLKG